MLQVRQVAGVLGLCLLLAGGSCQQGRQTQTASTGAGGAAVVETLQGGSQSGINMDDPWALQGYFGYRCDSNPQLQIELPAGGGELVNEATTLPGGSTALLHWRGRANSPLKLACFGTDNLGTAAASRFAQYVENLRSATNSRLVDAEQTLETNGRIWLLLPLPDKQEGGKLLRERLAVAQLGSKALCVSFRYDPAPELKVEASLIPYVLGSVRALE